MPRQDDADGPGRNLSDLPQYLRPQHRGHPLIGDDETHLSRPDSRQGFLGVFGRDDLIRLAAEQAPEGREDRRIVIDDDDDVSL